MVFLIHAFHKASKAVITKRPFTAFGVYFPNKVSIAVILISGLAAPGIRDRSQFTSAVILIYLFMP